MTSHKTYTKRLVNTEKDFCELFNILSSVDRFSYDTETNGTFDRFAVSLVGISFAIINETYNHAWYIPFNHFEGTQLPINYLTADLNVLFEDKSIEKICHNAKFDEMVLGRYGINVKGFAHDTYVMAWLLTEEAGRSGRGLKALTEKHFGVQMSTFEDVINDAPKKRGVARDYNFGQVDLEQALPYAADDSYYTHALYHYFRPQLEEQQIWPAYKNIEAPFNRVLRNVEARGVHIDLEAVERADQRLPEIAEEVEAEVYKEAGEVFNIGSGKQLGHILFEKLQIGKNVPKTKTGNYSTDKKTLTTYANHKIVENVLRRKKIQKTHSTFVKGLQGFIARDGKVHPSFNGQGTVTGRLSGNSPNLQQIEGDEVEEIKIRNFFIASEGFQFVVADYAQIEYRLMAHFSKDRAMLKAFASGHDFHEETAREAFKIADGESVAHRQRFIAKSINFGIGYGRGPTSLAETLGCTLGEAQEYIANYYRTFSGLAAFKKHVVTQARQNGFIRTLSGRKRRLLPDIRSDDWMLRSRAERQAFNTKIQGSAADLIKLAMISLEPELQELGAFIVIQIHDELVVECPEDKTDETVGIIKRIMENPLKGKNPLILPITTDPQIVDRWGEVDK